MKKLILGMVLLLSSTVATAAGVVNVSNTSVEWLVVNRYNAVMHCTGTLHGRTQYGQVYDERIDVTIYPNTHAARYIYTWGNAYFVEEWANVSCNL